MNKTQQEKALERKILVIVGFIFGVNFTFALLW